MKTKSILLFATALLATTLIAQPQRRPANCLPQNCPRAAQCKQFNYTPETTAQMRVERMKAQLSLTAEQEKSIKEISLKQAKAIAAQREKIEQLSEQCKTERQKYDAEIKALLNPDQLIKLEKIEKERRQTTNCNFPQNPKGNKNMRRNAPLNN